MDSCRIDYIKVARKLGEDMAQQLAKVWYDTFEGPNRNVDDARSAHVNSVRKEPDGKRLYIFEAWGINADRAEQLSWEGWAPYLDRIDIRGSASVTKGGVDRMYQHLSRAKVGGRNVQLFSSKIRSKRAGRDTGGYGIAIGSHKSDLRVTMYVRGTGTGAIEYQIQGKKLENVVSVVSKMPKDTDPWANKRQWDRLTLGLMAHCNVELRTMTALDDQSLASILNDEADQEQEVENKLAAIDAMLDGLAPEALQAVLYTLQLRLL